MCSLITQILKDFGVNVVFGVTGVPVTKLTFTLVENGIRFIGCHTETSAGYAASAYAYLSFANNTLPGVFISTAGPGFLNCMAVMGNAKYNKIPIVLISGSSSLSTRGQNDFQEFDQFAFMSKNLLCKESFQCKSLEDIPEVFSRAFQTALRAPCGPVYIDIPSDVLNQQNAIQYQVKSPSLEFSVLDNACLQIFIQKLNQATRPLIVVGEAIAFYNVQDSFVKFARAAEIPILPMPMARGCCSDDDVLCVAAIRSEVLKTADLVILCGAKLDWRLHFGRPPKYATNVQFIGIDAASPDDDQMFMLQGDMGKIFSALSQSKDLKHHSEWLQLASSKARAKRENPINYHPGEVGNLNYVEVMVTFEKHVKRWSQESSSITLISEGANTMDIARRHISCYEPRGRLDAGGWGTMGVGLPSFIAANFVYEKNKNHRIIALEGDSAIGFSLAELETISRFKLRGLIAVFNNGGIYTGKTMVDHIAPTQLSKDAKYHLVAEGLGVKGHAITTIQALDDCLNTLQPHDLVLLNILINPHDGNSYTSSINPHTTEAT